MSSLLLLCIGLGCFYSKIIAFCLSIKYFLLQFICTLWEKLQSLRSVWACCAILPSHISAHNRSPWWYQCSFWRVCVCVYVCIYISQKDQRKNFLCEWTERIAYRQTLDYLLKNSEADNLAERSRACAMLEILLSWASMHLGGLS